MLELIPHIGSLAFTICAFAVALIVIVFVHEYGHYIVGRWTGIKAEVFSIGIGPVLWSRTDRRGTRWQIAGLPLGGYVRFQGDANAASAGADATVMASLAAERKRASMPGAPVWARALTVAAGPAFNIVLSVLVFGVLAMIRGVAAEPLTVAAVPASLPYQQELEPGDVILGIDGVPLPAAESWADYFDALPDRIAQDYQIRRDGAEMTVTAPHPILPVVSGVVPDSAAADAGVEPGDVVMQVNGADVVRFGALSDITENSAGQPLDMLFWHDGAPRALSILPRMSEVPQSDGSIKTRWAIGMTGGGFWIEPVTQVPGPVASLAAGWDSMTYIVRSSLTGMYQVIVGDVSTCAIRGPVTIARTSGSAAAEGLLTFIWFIAVLSTAVGVLNLLPIPVLDGGHLAFHAYEAVFRRPPAPWAMRIMLAAGLALLLMLMLFAVSNDFRCP